MELPQCQHMGLALHVDGDGVDAFLGVIHAREPVLALALNVYEGDTDERRVVLQFALAAVGLCDELVLRINLPVDAEPLHALVLLREEMGFIGVLKVHRLNLDAVNSGPAIGLRLLRRDIERRSEVHRFMDTPSACVVATMEDTTPLHRYIGVEWFHVNSSVRVSGTCCLMRSSDNLMYSGFNSIPI